MKRFLVVSFLTILALTFSFSTPSSSLASTEEAHMIISVNKQASRITEAELEETFLWNEILRLGDEKTIIFSEEKFFSIARERHELTSEKMRLLEKNETTFLSSNEMNSLESIVSSLSETAFLEDNQIVKVVFPNGMFPDVPAFPLLPDGKTWALLLNDKTESKLPFIIQMWKDYSGLIGKPLPPPTMNVWFAGYIGVIPPEQVAKWEANDGMTSNNINQLVNLRLKENTYWLPHWNFSCVEKDGIVYFWIFIQATGVSMRYPFHPNYPGAIYQILYKPPMEAIIPTINFLVLPKK